MTEVSGQMKKDNWAFFVLARSNDPAVMIPYTRKLMSNLINAMRIAGETQYDNLLLAMLRDANNALQMATDKEDPCVGEATQIAEMVLDQITFLVYDSRWATAQEGSFRMPTKEKVT